MTGESLWPGDLNTSYAGLERNPLKHSEGCKRMKLVLARLDRSTVSKVFWKGRPKCQLPSDLKGGFDSTLQSRC